MLRWAVEGPAYVPFIGDGDLAVELYADRRVYGADLDPDRVEIAQSRLPNALVVEADCDQWVFPQITDSFAIADFDAYADPYTGFRSFWPNARHEDRLVVFFTDGRRQGAMRTGHWTRPDGTKVHLDTLKKRQDVYWPYLTKHVWPWFDDFIAGHKVLDRWRYQRGMMIYWGAVIERV